MQNEDSIINAKKQSPYAFEAIQKDPEWKPYRQYLNGVCELERHFKSINQKIQSASAGGAPGYFFRQEDFHDLLSKINKMQKQHNVVLKQNMDYRHKLGIYKAENELLKTKVPTEKPKGRLFEMSELFRKGDITLEQYKQYLDDFANTKPLRKYAERQGA